MTECVNLSNNKIKTNIIYYNYSKCKFTVVDVKPDSILGYNLYAGEHLNFISDEGRGVHAGDEITIIVTGVKPVLADSYKISYVLLDRQSG